MVHQHQAFHWQCSRVQLRHVRADAARLGVVPAARASVVVVRLLVLQYHARHALEELLALHTFRHEAFLKLAMRLQRLPLIQLLLALRCLALL